MNQKVSVIFRHGALFPESELPLVEEKKYEITIQDAVPAQPNLVPPRIADPEERKRNMSDFIAHLPQLAIPEDFPRFTRDELHERR